MGSLTKGEVSSITKKAPGVTKVKFGLGWDAPEDAPIDLDAIVFLLGSDGQLVDKSSGVIFFNNKAAHGVVHSGDNRTGAGEGYDETVVIDLAALPQEVTEARCTVYSYSGQDLSTVSNVLAGVLKADDESAIETFDAGALGAVLGADLGSYIRNGDEWDFKAGGDSITSSLADLFAKYGYVDPAA